MKYDNIGAANKEINRLLDGWMHANDKILDLQLTIVGLKDEIRRLQPREFCGYCGAGVGAFRRDGEGTCEECDPQPIEKEV